MAEPQASNGTWKRGLAAVFVLLALIGVILGIIAGVAPDKLHKDKASHGSSSSPVSSVAKTQEDTTAVTPEQTVAEDNNKQTAPVVPAPAKPTTPATTPAATPATPATTPAKTPGGGLIGLPSTSTAASGTTGGNVISGVVSQVLGADTATSIKQQLPAGVTAEQATTAINNVVRGDFQQVISTTGSCVAQDGPQFVTMMTGSTCCLIQLLPGVVYDIGEDQIEVYGRKVVVGNPLDLPTLDGQNAPRIFRVKPGGYLDLRYVRTYRGGGELIATIPVLMGGSVYIEAGGRGNFLGCIFTNADPENPAILIAPNLSRAVRVFGGQLYIAGGIVTVTLCHFWVMQPGVLLREVYLMGAEILLGAGVLVVSGSTFTNSQIFLNVVGCSAFIAQLGGALVASGCTFTVNTGVLHASGAGISNFLGGGVAIYSGCTWALNLGALAHFGTGIIFFNGGGVLIVSGSAQTVETGASIACGAGPFLTLGAGVAVYSGVAQAFTSGASFLAGAGIINWLGSGSFTATGHSISRVIGTAAVYGIGGSFGSGGGSMVVVGCPSTDVYGSISVALVGGDIFLGSGILIDVGNPFAKVIGVGFLALYGIHSFVGAGGLVLYGSPAGLALGQVYVAPSPPAVYVIRGQSVGPNGFYARRRQLQDGSDVATAEMPSDEVNMDEVPTFLTLQNAVPVTQSGTDNEFIKAIVGDRTPPAPLDIKIAQVDGNTQCNVCATDLSPDQLIGSMAGGCTYDASACSVASATTSANAPTPVWMSDVADLLNTGKLLDTNVVSSTFKIGCNAAEGADPNAVECLADHKTLTDVIQDGFANDCAKIHVAPQQLPAVDELSDIHANLKDDLPDSDKTQKFDVMFTTHDDQCTQSVKDYLTAQTADKTGLAETLNQLTHSSVLVNDAAIDTLTTHVAKGMDFNTAIKNVLPNALGSSELSLTPTVLVTADKDLAQPTIPSDGTATVVLKNFMEGQDVNLSLSKDCSATSSSNVPVYTTNFAPGDNGSMLVDVPLANGSIADGKYAMLAQQNGVSWCSQPFIVSS